MNESSSPTIAPPLSLATNARLSAMMLLQYAIWGAWLPLLYTFLSVHRGFTPTQVGTMFSVGAVGAILAPFIAGQIADRYFATQRFLGVSHLLGAALVWQLSGIETYWGFLAFSLIYSVVYSPTLPLTNSLAFHHLPDRDRDFGKVRLWGTLGWIVVGIGIGQWLLHTHTISPQEAAERVFDERLANKEERNRLLTWTHFELENGDTVLGEVVSSEGATDSVTVRVTKGDTIEPVEVALNTIKTRRIYFATLAAGTEEEPDVPTAENRTAIGAALAALEAGPPLPDTIRADLKAGLVRDEVFSEAALAVPTKAGQAAGMADAFRLSAILGVIMGLFCLFGLPHTPPTTGRDKNAPLEAISEVRRNPLATLFLLAIPISCIHQFYFVHTEPFLGSYQTNPNGLIERIFGVGGGGLMALGQVSEIFVLAAMPFLAKRLSRKTLLATGIIAYGLRMAIFGYGDALAAATGLPVVPILIVGVVLHGLCFGCFIFVAFMIVDEQTTSDVRASAQSLFNLVIIGFGTIVGSLIATSTKEWAGDNYTRLFSVPLWGSVGCLLILLLFYPGKRRATTSATSPEGNSP